MSSNGQEIESKFYVRSLENVEKRLVTLGAVCKVPRGFEYNLRYDDAQKSLGHERKLLRLRKSDDVRLTFKGPSELRGGSVARTEIEVIVNDFETARQLIESLGYQVWMIYEKYRAIYDFAGAAIMLDELPYGNFVEIEGESPQAIADIAAKLGLKADAAIPVSYQGLFERLKAAKDLSAKNVAFEEFKGVQVTPEELGVVLAD